MAVLALTRKFIVSRADTHLGGQTIRIAKGIYIGAEFHQQPGGADQIDPGNRLGKAKASRSESSSVRTRIAEGAPNVVTTYGLYIGLNGLFQHGQYGRWISYR